MAMNNMNGGKPVQHRLRRPEADPWEDFKHRVVIGAVLTLIVAVISAITGG